MEMTSGEEDKEGSEIKEDVVVLRRRSGPAPPF
jgi:hypothetical protein